MILGVIKNGEKELLVGGAAANVSYNNGNSGLTATDVQGAVDELSADIADKASKEWTKIDEVSKTGTTGQYAIKTVTADISSYKEFLLQVIADTNTIQSTAIGLPSQEIMTWETRAISASVDICSSGKFTPSTKELSVSIRFASISIIRKAVLYGR